MPRQLYGLGSLVRKLIPNELANLASKAAPFVAPFNPLAAGIMRGVGRYDKRGDLGDAFKQGALTFGFGKGVGMLGGAQSDGFFGGQTFTREGFEQGPIGRLFQRPEVNLEKTSTDPKGIKSVIEGSKKLDDIPIIGELPNMVKQQILVGGVTAAGTYIYEKFLAEEPPQDTSETMEEYLARRKQNVGKKMRTYFDNYFACDPEYAALDDEGRNAFVERYNLRGGGMPMGIMRTNQAGVMERDYRDKGGFVPVGIKEKADDVPAMLSKNEFVMTANAVRGAGNGSIEKGAQKMYDTMKKLERRVI